MQLSVQLQLEQLSHRRDQPRPHRECFHRKARRGEAQRVQRDKKKNKKRDVALTPATMGWRA